MGLLGSPTARETSFGGGGGGGGDGGEPAVEGPGCSISGRELDGYRFTDKMKKL